MSWDEIEVPKEVRQFMLDGAEETNLGKKNGAKKQYRYGNLHIREYDDKFLVHMDKFDPRKSPFAHLVFDAPEVLVGLACAAIGGTKIAKQKSILAGLASSLVIGYGAYKLSKIIKEKKSKGDSI